MESLAPHRTLGVDENDELIDHLAETKTGYDGQQDFAAMILEHLNTSGVQQARREDRISFTALTPWPGDLICAEGRYVEGAADTGTERRAGIFIGPEFGTVARPDLVAAAREAADADFDVLIACAFSYEAHATEFSKLGRIPILKARMNADLHMAGDLKNTGKGNLFVIFGEPDIEIIPVQDNGTGARQIQVKVNGVDVFHPNTGEIRSDGPDGIACWFVDTDYNEESFFVRHAYFLGASDPYKALKDHPQDRDPPRRLGNPAQRHLPPLRPPRLRPHRRQSNQPPRRRSNESLPRLSSAGECVAQWNNRCVSSSMRQIGATSTGRGFGSGRRGCDMNGVQRDAEARDKRRVRALEQLADPRRPVAVTTVMTKGERAWTHHAFVWRCCLVGQEVSFRVFSDYAGYRINADRLQYPRVRTDAPDNSSRLILYVQFFGYTVCDHTSYVPINTASIFPQTWQNKRPSAKPRVPSRVDQ